MGDTGTPAIPFPAFLASWIQLLVPQPCFDTFFVEFDLLHVPCLKVVISKVLGFSIILGSLIVKVPQIVKLLHSHSGEGISMTSVSCELLAISASWSYGFARKFPFSSYGEAVFMAIQTVLIAFLVLYFKGKRAAAIGYLGSYIAAMSFLLSPAAPHQLLSSLQASNVFVIMISKAIQAYANYRNRSTGQLSAITVFLMFLGAIARIFTSIQETGDKLIVFTFIISSIFNGIIALQMIIYWNVTCPKRD